MTFNILAVIACLGFIFFFVTRSKIGPFFILLAYTQGSGIISSAVVETGYYVTEVDRVASFIGASKWYALTIFCLFALVWTFQIGIEKLLPPPSVSFKRRSNYERIVLSGIFLILSILYFNVFISGPPLFSSHITRFNFWDHYSAIPFIGTIFGELSVPIIISISILIFRKLIYRDSSNIPKIYFFAMAMYFLYLALLGHKFNGFIVAGSFLVALVLISRNISHTRIIKPVDFIYVGIAISGMFYASYVFFSGSAGGVIDFVGGNAIYGVIYRAFVLQGYSWHSFFEMYQLYGVHADSGNTSAMEYAINAITARPNFYIENGISIANIYPGVLLIRHGIFGVILGTILFSAFLAIFGVISYRLLIAGSIVRTTMAAQLLFWTMGAVPSCNIDVFISYKFITIFLLMLAAQLFRKSRIT